jgi:pimeloyl-ACP methyl ester carboxylesterase
MAVHTTTDGTRLVHDDWGAGRPVVLVHGWSLDATMWEHQAAALVAAGLRCVTYDRRGHGRSQDPGRGYDADGLADDLAGLLEDLDLTDAVLVGHSMGGGEVVRYLARHGSARVSAVALVASLTPFALATPDHPVGVPAEALQQTALALTRDRAGWFAAGADGYFALDGAGAWVSPAMVDRTLRTCLGTPLLVQLACARTAFTTDYRADLRSVDVPALVVHGDVDVSAPLVMTGEPTAALLPRGELVVYEGAAHGLYATHQDRLSADLLRLVAASAAPTTSRRAS